MILIRLFSRRSDNSHVILDGYGKVDKNEDDLDFEKRIKSIRKSQNAAGVLGRLVLGSSSGAITGGAAGLAGIAMSKKNIPDKKVNKIIKASALIGTGIGSLGGYYKASQNNKKNKKAEKEIIQDYKNLTMKGRHAPGDVRFNFRNKYLNGIDEYLYQTRNKK